MTWKNEIIKKLPVKWLVIFTGMIIVLYFGYQFYDRYLTLKEIEIVYGAASGTKKERNQFAVYKNKPIKTASSTY